VADASDRSDAARAIARYSPVSLPEDLADFARAVVARAQPQSPARAKALLFAAGKLGSFATSIGLELSASVVFAPSLIERFIVTEGAALGPATRRTLRSNLRFIARAVVENPTPAPLPLSRERSKAPYSPAHIDAYLALADAQATPGRQIRLGALICLGAGAGLMGADLRAVRGIDVVERSGGVLVEVATLRPRVVPVLTPYQDRLLAAARFAGPGFVIGGYSASRRNVTSGLVASLAGGADLPALDTSRLRATWLTSCARLIGLKAFMDAAGITCTQRLGDLVAGLDHVDEERAVALMGAAAR
jgi:integrase